MSRCASLWTRALISLFAGGGAICVGRAERSQPLDASCEASSRPLARATRGRAPSDLGVLYARRVAMIVSDVNLEVGEEGRSFPLERSDDRDGEAADLEIRALARS